MVVMMMVMRVVMGVVVGGECLLAGQDDPLSLALQGIGGRRWRVTKIRLAGGRRRRTAGRLAVTSPLVRVTLLDVDGSGATLFTDGYLATGTTGHRRGRVLLLLVGACHCTRAAPALR